MQNHTIQLYAITDSTLMPTTQILHQRTEQALAAGVHWIQYRDKSQDMAKRLEQAKALKVLCLKYDGKLIINDDVSLAAEINADGVHLGQGDGDLQQARAQLGEHAIIGSTCHDSLELAHRAVDQGASYVAFGRFFSSNTKPNAQHAPLSLLEKANTQLSCPIVAIGGITPDNATELVQAGASTLAVCHSLFADDKVEYRARRFTELAI